MPKVAVVTDSTATIPQDLIEKYNISVVPQVLIWAEETFLDGVDIKPDEFYTRLTSAKVMPSTSQATPGAFQSVFTKLLEEDCEIIAILVSNKLSGTIPSANQAKQLFPDKVIEIVDSETIAMAMGFQVLSVARAVEQGADIKECVELAEKTKQHTGVVFAVDTLEFLHRGGRIGGAKRFLGTALKVKPISEVVGGGVEAIESVRTRTKSLTRLVELVEERISGRTPVRIATLHANAPEEAEQLLKLANEKFQATESLFSVVSPVVGTHAGPGTVGLAYMAGL
jgi:DegV family protein with EDD domain